MFESVAGAVLGSGGKPASKAGGDSKSFWAQSPLEQNLPGMDGAGSGTGRYCRRWCSGGGMCQPRGYAKTAQMGGLVSETLCFTETAGQGRTSWQGVLHAWLCSKRGEPRVGKIAFGCMQECEQKGCGLLCQLKSV